MPATKGSFEEFIKLKASGVSSSQPSEKCFYPPHRLTCFSDPTVVPTLSEGNSAPVNLDVGNAFVIESKQHWSGHRRGIGGKLSKADRFQEGGASALSLALGYGRSSSSSFGQFGSSSSSSPSKPQHVHYRAYPEPVGKLALGPNWEKGRIPETLKATSSPAPIDRQWQGTVADNVDGGNGGGDRSSTNGDVWVPRAVCGAVPPSSAFANQVHRHLPWDAPAPKSAAAAAANAPSTAFSRELDAILGGVASAKDPSSSALQRPLATTPMAVGMIAAKQSAAASATGNAPLLQISKPGSAARHSSSSSRGQGGSRSISNGGDGNNSAGADKTLQASPKPSAVATSETGNDPSIKPLASSDTPGDSVGSSGMGAANLGKQVDDSALAPAAAKPLLEFGYEQLSPRWFKDGSSRATAHSSSGGGNSGCSSNRGGGGGDGGNGSVGDGAGDSLLGVSSHESMGESLSWSDMPLAHFAQPPSNNNSATYYSRGGGAGGGDSNYSRNSRSRSNSDPEVPLPSRASRLGISHSQPSASTSSASSQPINSSHHRSNGKVGRRPRLAIGQDASSEQHLTTVLSSSTSSYKSPSPRPRNNFRGSFSPIDDASPIVGPNQGAMAVPSVSPPAPPADATIGSLGGGGSVAAFGSVGSFNKSHHRQNSSSNFYNLQNSSSEAESAAAANGGFEVAMGLAGATPPLLQRSQKPLGPADQRRARRARDAAANLSAAAPSEGTAAAAPAAPAAADNPSEEVGSGASGSASGPVATTAARAPRASSSSGPTRPSSPGHHRGLTKWTSPAVTPPNSSLQQTSKGSLLAPRTGGNVQVPLKRNGSRSNGSRTGKRLGHSPIATARPSRSREDSATPGELSAEEGEREVRGLRFHEIVPPRGAEAIRNLKFGGICGPFLV